MKYSTIAKPIFYTSFSLLVVLTLGVQASFGPADLVKTFTFTSLFERNPKIWGTYQLRSENLTDFKGKNITLPKRVSDLVISDGHLTFVREIKPEDTTKIVVERIPYKKKKKAFKNRETRLMQERMDRLLTYTLRERLSLSQEERIIYNEVKCLRVKKGIQCRVVGLVN